MNVTVIGTCRVVTPFALLHNAGRVRLRNEGVFGFVHGAKEVIQQLEIMHGHRRLPLEIAPYVRHEGSVGEGDGWARTRRNDLSGTELLVVEISSLKELELDGWYLQLNRVRKLLIGEDPHLQQWWGRVPREGSAARRHLDLEKVEDPVVRRIVASLRVGFQGEDSLLEDMRRIRTFFDGRIVFATHFDVPTPSGERLPRRALLARTVAAGARELGCEFYDPTPLVEAFGRDRALTDMAHYTREFDHAVAEDLGARFLAPLGVSGS